MGLEGRGEGERMERIKTTLSLEQSGLNKERSFYSTIKQRILTVLMNR